MLIGESKVVGRKKKRSVWWEKTHTAQQAVEQLPHLFVHLVHFVVQLPHLSLSIVQKVLPAVVLSQQTEPLSRYRRAIVSQ